MCCGIGRGGEEGLVSAWWYRAGGNEERGRDLGLESNSKGLDKKKQSVRSSLLDNRSLRPSLVVSLLDGLR